MWTITRRNTLFPEPKSKEEQSVIESLLIISIHLCICAIIFKHLAYPTTFLLLKIKVKALVNDLASVVDLFQIHVKNNVNNWLCSKQFDYPHVSESTGKLKTESSQSSFISIFISNFQHRCIHLIVVKNGHLYLMPRKNHCRCRIRFQTRLESMLGQKCGLA